MDVKKVDFKNFTYEMGDLSGEGKMKITVKTVNFRAMMKTTGFILK